MIRANKFAAYPHEFKVEAIRLVRESGKSTRDIATDLGVSVVSLNRWLKDPELGGTERWTPLFGHFLLVLRFYHSLTACVTDSSWLCSGGEAGSAGSIFL